MQPGRMGAGPVHSEPHPSDGLPQGMTVHGNRDGTAGPTRNGTVNGTTARTARSELHIPLSPFEATHRRIFNVPLSRFGTAGAPGSKTSRDNINHLDQFILIVKIMLFSLRHEIDDFRTSDQN